MSSSTKNQITPKRTVVHYKYRLVLELGLDPYEVPEKVTHYYDTWSEVCQGIFNNLGQSMDKSDDSIRHCGKWYVTNYGRGKILQVVDFYEYEYDSDTEYVIQNNHHIDPTLVDTSVADAENYYADLKQERDIQQTENNENESEETFDEDNNVADEVYGADEVYEADEEGSSNEEELNNNDTNDSVVTTFLNTTEDPDDSDDSSEVESLHNLIKNNNMSIGEIKETATKCIDEVMSCNIL